ncbi:hypothetical protein E4U57_000696 [Claviceps arundinis]|uniref:Uncharacterized protein n=1 Tax=Claviceps arundinis TaxID=1623583 RepID=A0ABQ7PLL9_9HYPO|nr:hypothetical protein E4U57_000696 [Claviceps arundinis]
MAQAPTNDDDLASRVQSLGINSATQIQDLGQEADAENKRLYPYLLNPKLKCFGKYISQDWYECEDEYVNLFYGKLLYYTLWTLELGSRKRSTRLRAHKDPHNFKRKRVKTNDNIRFETSNL